VQLAPLRPEKASGAADIWLASDKPAATAAMRSADDARERKSAGVTQAVRK
jgi:hypothetical protein